MKNGDYTLYINGTIYRFPTEAEMDEWIAENKED